MKESGVVPFDASAVRAFQEAAVFPNPPQEMIQEDGFIHLKFAFTVNFRPPTLVNSN
jgi:outer membrane biosynthesis protein TonB